MTNLCLSGEIVVVQVLHYVVHGHANECFLQTTRDDGVLADGEVDDGDDDALGMVFLRKYVDARQPVAEFGVVDFDKNTAS